MIRRHPPSWRPPCWCAVPDPERVAAHRRAARGGRRPVSRRIGDVPDRRLHHGALRRRPATVDRRSREDLIADLGSTFQHYLRGELGSEVADENLRSAACWRVGGRCWSRWWWSRWPASPSIGCTASSGRTTTSRPAVRCRTTTPRPRPNMSSSRSSASRVRRRPSPTSTSTRSTACRQRPAAVVLRRHHHPARRVHQRCGQGQVIPWAAASRSTGAVKDERTVNTLERLHLRLESPGERHQAQHSPVVHRIARGIRWFSVPIVLV